MRRLKVLELFSGTRSVSKAFERRGHDTFCVDYDEKFDADWHADIGKITAAQLVKRFGHPDVLFASPDCSSFSLAAISKHRRKDPFGGGLLAVSEYAKECDRVDVNLMRIIRDLHVPLIWIENPRGGMRKADWLQWCPRHTVTYCLAGETRVITPDGEVPIKDLCGSSPHVLTTGGRWVAAPIRCYGTQPLMRINLSRCGVKKTIYATADHLWMVDGKAVPTSKLRSYMSLDYAQPNRHKRRIIPEWVARGFTFGDGWVLSAQERSKSFAMFCGEKVEMTSYFAGHCGKPWIDIHGGKPVTKLYGMPREWKTVIPSVKDGLDEIYSWLAGYFAADGSVGSKNCQSTIASARKENLERVRVLCRAVGIGTYDIGAYLRTGYGNSSSTIYSLTLMRSDLTEEFFLRSRHRENFNHKQKTSHQVRRWRVVSVEDGNRIEPVYCAEVADTHCFAIEGDILTHNCQYTRDLPPEQRRMKPTDIFTNHPNPGFLPPCKNGDPCHARAPRGSRTGTQGLTWEDRIRIPDALCDHIVLASEDYIARLDAANAWLVENGMEPLTIHWPDVDEPAQGRLFE